MKIKTLLVFITIAAGSLQASYAERVALQDSVRKVYVTVVASEKVLVEDRDINNPEESVAEAPVRNKTYSSARKKTKILQVPKAITTNPKTLNTAEREDNSTVSIIIKKVAKPNTTVKNSGNKPEQAITETGKYKEQDVINNSKPTLAEEGSLPQTSKIYLWVGTVLVVIGMILGILFGKTALLVSIAGIVFVIIGYTIKT